jgi:hypothetical protein
MTKKLHISDDLSLPLDAATQTIAVVARKGAGKTYAASKLVEELLGHGVQTVVMDTVGNWYGLRIAANGKDRGFDIPVLGGLRGDVPLTPESGALIADLVVDTGRSFVIDLSQFSLGARKKFATSFGEQLWKRKKGEAEPSAVHVVLEECQLIIPQFVGRDDARMVGIWEEIVRLGRNYGIGVTMITQRPQSVNKEVLTQTECLLVLQVNGVPERKALKEWIVHQGADVDLLNELPSLPVGTAYLWSPQWLRTFERIRIAKKTTLDASATPKVGERRVKVELKPLDLGELKARMEQVTAAAEQNDPTALHRRIRQLEAELKKPTAVAKPEVKEVPIITESDHRTLRELFEAARADFDKVAAKVESLATVLRELGTQVPRPAPMAAPPRGFTTPTRPARPTVVQVERNGEVSEYGLLLLRTVAARHPMKLTRAQISTLSGRSPRSSAFTGAMAEIIKGGFLAQVGGGLHELTETGLAAAGGPAAPPSSGEVIDQWRNALPGYERLLFDVLVDAYPKALTRPELAERSNKSITSSAFTAAISTLAKNGLAEVASGEVRASADLFLSGAA